MRNVLPRRPIPEPQNKEEAMAASIDRPQPRAELLAIDVYVRGASGAGVVGKIHKLSSNESPLGPSPSAMAAYQAESDKLALYPDGSATALRAAIADRYGLDKDRIICGNGSDELLGMLAHVFLSPGDEAIYSQFGFLSYPIAIRAAGGTPVVAPETDYTADVDSILSKVGPKTRIVFLANPNNPTGAYLPVSEVKRLHSALPKTVLLVIDAAYAEYVQRNDYVSGIELVSDYQNVVMTRTFSKIHGLAALRIGWAYAPAEIIDVMQRIRGPFNVNSAALAAGVAAIQDSAHVEAAIVHNQRWLTFVSEELKALGLAVLPSVGNFVLIRFPGGRPMADAAYAALNAEGFILRPMRAYGLSEGLRLTIGDEESNRGVVAALGRFMRARHLSKEGDVVKEGHGAA
jgi:histidinol-phosphate aminotransferase